MSWFVEHWFITAVAVVFGSIFIHAEWSARKARRNYVHKDHDVQQCEVHVSIDTPRERKTLVYAFEGDLWYWDYDKSYNVSTATERAKQFIKDDERLRDPKNPDVWYPRHRAYRYDIQNMKPLIMNEKDAARR